MFKNIRVVLVRTFHSGNIGSAARAMKTMGLSDLVLVEPVDYNTEIGQHEATKMAVSADDVVKNIRQFDTLYEAVKDCTVVVASTARSRGYDLPSITPEQSAEMLYTTANKHGEKVALVFGPERMGLSNDDLMLAKYRVTIPTNPNYSSLNLAAAVQTLCYEVLKQQEEQEYKVGDQFDRLVSHSSFPTTKNQEGFYQYLEETLKSSGFIIKKHPGEVMHKIRAIFSRSQLDQTELNILRGAFASFQDQNRKNTKN